MIVDGGSGTTSLGGSITLALWSRIRHLPGGLSISTSNAGTAGVSGGVSLANGSVGLGRDSGDLSTQQPVFCC